MHRVPLADLAAWWSGLPPRAGRVTVLAVDGRSGAGKTRFATALAASAPGSTLVATDELHPGWDGLAAAVPLLVENVLEPLAAGLPARVPTWDWAADAPGPVRPLSVPGPLLLVEGLGSAARAAARHLSGIVWLEADEEVRRPRALARDGAGYAPHWARWARQEEEYLRTERPDRRADLVVDGAAPGPDVVLLRDARR